MEHLAQENRVSPVKLAAFCTVYQIFIIQKHQEEVDRVEQERQEALERKLRAQREAEWVRFAHHTFQLLSPGQMLNSSLICGG